MVARYQLPEIADLIRLNNPHEYAITVYAETSPGPDHRDNSLLTAKSAVDSALRDVKDGGARHATVEQLRARWIEIANSDLWLRLSRSVAIFIAEDFHEVYVLPNALETQSQAGVYFDTGQLVRAVTTPQRAFALTLSANSWGLWQATAGSRAEPMTLAGDHPADVAEATNRVTVRDRDHVRRLVGDEGRKVLLETYAKRVAEAVEYELAQVDSAGEDPLFVFATDPLLDLYRGIENKREVIAVPGSPDALRPDQIDDSIRQALPSLNARRANALVDELGDGVGSGLVATDLADIARAAVSGAVATLVYDFTVDILGQLDDTTGAVRYAEDGYDLLSRLAVLVLDKGGRVVAVRPGEVSAQIWPGTAVAGLRFALT